MKPPKQIQVLDLTPIEDGGALKAIASVRCGSLVFHRLRVLINPSGVVSLAGPQIVHQTEQGRRHFTLIRLPKPWRTAILAAIQQVQEGMAP